MITPEPPSPYHRIGLTLLFFLCAMELPLAFRAGAYFPRSWMPVAVLVAAVALVIILFGPPPRLSRLQGALLGVFLLQAAWTIASLLWAGSRANAWEEADRTLFYLLGAALATLAVGWAGPSGLRRLALGVLAAIGVVGAAVMVRLALGENTFNAITEGRLHYPVGYWNGLAALLMMGFWLALGLGTGQARPWWRRAVLQAVAAMLVALAVLPQSRGSLWTFVLVLPWFVALTPNRFRGVVNLAAVVGLTAIAWPTLTGVWAARPGGLAQTQAAAAAEQVVFRGALHDALLAILLCGVAAFAVSVVVSAVEARISPLERRWVLRIGVALVVLALLGVGLGLVAFQRAEGDLTGFANRAWDQLTADGGGAGANSGSRFTDFGLNGRLRTWRIAERAFAEQPLLGHGAQNFEFYFIEHRATGLTVRHAHSQPMQLLSDLGLPGAVACALFIGGALFLGVRMRFRARRPENQAALAAAVLAVGSWAIHSSADWLWQLGGVTWPAVLLLGGLVATGAATAPAGDGTSDARSTRVPGVSPVVVRVAVAGVALLLLVSGSLYYVSLRYLDKTFDGDGSPASVVGATTWAGRLNPFSPEPPMMLAFAYEQVAAQARSSGDLDTTMTDSALAAGAWADAVEREPLAWDLHYFAGLATLDYRDAAVAAGLLAPPGDGQNAAPSGAAGIAGAPSGTGPATPAAFRQATWEELNGWARARLQEARRLNPLDESVVQALARLAE